MSVFFTHVPDAFKRRFSSPGVTGRFTLKIKVRRRVTPFAPHTP